MSGRRNHGHRSYNPDALSDYGFGDGGSSQGAEISWPSFRSMINSPNHTRKNYIIFIYSPNCPHCRNFEPQWQKFLRDNQRNIGQNYEFHKMDATRRSNSEAINYFNVQVFPAVMKLRGPNVSRTMDSGYADIDMGYSWLATAAGMQPGEYDGGFPIPIFAKKGQENLADTIEGKELSDSDSDGWEDAQQGPQLAMKGAPVSPIENLDDNQENFDTAFERLSAQQAEHPGSDMVYSQDETTPASMKALAETGNQVKAQLGIQSPLFDGYSNPMGDPVEDQGFDDNDDDVMSGDKIDAMQYMVQRDQETPGGGLFSDQIRDSDTDDVNDNNIDQWDEIN